MRKRSNTSSLLIVVALSLILFTSCKSHYGAGGTRSGLGLTPEVSVETEADIIPAENRISYTIDGRTPDGERKLHKLTLQQAYQLALTEAADLHNCDRLLDPRETHEVKGKKILSITVTGRPGSYKKKTLPQVIQSNTGTPATDNGSAVVYHVVQEGETLAKIAKTYKVTVGQICTWNNLTNTKVAPGKKLVLQVK